MTDSTRDNVSLAAPAVASLAKGSFPRAQFRSWGVYGLLAGALIAILTLFTTYQNAGADAPLVEKSSLGQLGAWMAEQSAQDAPVSLLGQFAKSQAAAQGQSSLDVMTINNAMRAGLGVFTGATLAAGIGGLVGLALKTRWATSSLLLTLIGLDILIFIIPPLEGESAVTILLIAMVLLLAVLLMASGRASKVIGFVVVLSALFVAWEVLKGFGAATNYQITLPQAGWTVKTYNSVDETLVGLQNGEIGAVILDGKEVKEIVPETGDDAAGFQYGDLRIVAAIETETRGLLGLPIIPEFPGRLAVIVRESDVERWNSVGELVGQNVGTFSGSFSYEKFLTQERRLLMLDLKITNDLNLPHLQSIFESLVQPARRNGELLLVRILSGTALFTWSEALIGFTSGAILGFVLGTLFAHSRLLERGLLPYVVASQTVPILAIAPMVIIWLGAGPGAVAVISAYLTFFPVTINTLRGLTSPNPVALELMDSYAANWWTTLWKLRFPSALPYIFTALKVSATASVVGAIIGELPSGVGEGLGRTILNFNQYYTSDPSKLWAAIFIAAMVGIIFFVMVTVLERIVLGRRGMGN